VVVSHRQLVATVATIAVERSLAATDFADAALVAVVDALLLALVVVQGADGAVVLTKTVVAALALS